MTREPSPKTHSAGSTAAQEDGGYSRHRAKLNLQLAIELTKPLATAQAALPRKKMEVALGTGSPSGGGARNKTDADALAKRLRERSQKYLASGEVKLTHTATSLLLDMPPMTSYEVLRRYYGAIKALLRLY